MTKRPRCRLILLIFVCGFVNCGFAVPQTPVVLKKNGGWCWFQSPRAIVVNGKVILTSIAGDDHGDSDAGDLWATSFKPGTGQIENFLLHARLNRDDHALAGLCELADQRVLAVYGTHGNDERQRYRTTLQPVDIRAWRDEQSAAIGAKYTYSNVYRLPAENNRIYNFHRGMGFNPNCTYSDDGGKSWQHGWRLSKSTRKELQLDPRHTGLDGTRPYVCYTSNHNDEIHFVMSNDHPRAYDNSIYHGYYKSGKLFDSGGRELANPSDKDYQPLRPDDFTELFAGDADHVGWPCDIQLDTEGHAIVAYSVQVDGRATRTQRKLGGADHRYYFGRWDGQRWNVHEMAYAGTKLYAGEDDYTGLAAIDPNDPNVVVISTNANPLTGEPLESTADNQRHWELYRGTTSDGGAHWDWTALTSNSKEDQLRPVIPNWPGGPRVFLWARGKLTNYMDYDLDIVALVEKR